MYVLYIVLELEISVQICVFTHFRNPFESGQIRDPTVVTKESYPTNPTFIFVGR